MSMIAYREAILKIQEAAQKRPLQEERVPLLMGVGRTLTEDLFSSENLPAKDNSAMDGFVVRSEETLTATPEKPCLFPVLGYVAAGDAFVQRDDLEGGVYGIMTGALLPERDFDAVVKVEDVEVFFDGGMSFICVKAPVPKGNNVRPQGSDFLKGARILKRGHSLRHEDVMALASLGYSEVCVFKKLKVGVISTGKEVVPYATAMVTPQQVRNSSAPFLQSYFSSLGCDVDIFEQNEDSPQKFHQKFQELLMNNYDVLLTTGGVSMGNWDYVTDALSELGVRTEFHKVAIRPGKPLLFGVHEETRTAVFGLPGNPVSTAVGASFFVTPYLKTLRGESTQRALNIPCSHAIKKPQGLRCFFKARIECDNGVSRVRILPGQGSYMLHSLLEANCWAVLPEEGDFLEEGATVEVHPWGGRDL
ncbi:molybdopterin molybdotransferase MoeA [Bdellovibrio sp.]|uniref:molybdopterin molybdotransferase MoeA n=1 Tax=Bdellovibrio sp. TaxID=28201 RepID=UPI0039E32329